ncbi:MAG: hypothetical protein ACRD3B_13465 [Candidatus Sulfotelmatobacter sp.]
MKIAIVGVLLFVASAAAAQSGIVNEAKTKIAESKTQGADREGKEASRRKKNASRCG